MASQFGFGAKGIQDSVSNVIDALAPDATQSRFPYPSLVTSFGSSGVHVAEGPVINGQVMPGQWLLQELTRVFGWEMRQGNYLTGATLVPSGDPLVKVKYQIKIFNDADAGTYRQLLKTILKKPLIQVTGTSTGIIQTNTSTAALGIDDPSLKDMGITTVVVSSVTPLFNPLVHSGGKGAWTASVEFWEFRTPIKALPIPDQTISDPGAVTPAAYDMLTQEQANMSAGANQLQAAAAQQLLPH